MEKIKIYDLLNDLRQVTLRLHNVLDKLELTLSDSIEKQIKVVLEEQKRKELHNQRIRTFLDTLANDETLAGMPSTDYSTASLLYMMNNSIRFNSTSGPATEDKVVSSQGMAIDAAELVNLLFRKKGYQCSVQDFMDYVIAGGKSEDFFRAFEAGKDVDDHPLRRELNEN